MTSEKITRNRLRDILNYDLSTGLFTWRVTISNRARAGNEAGTHHKATGYIVIAVDGVGYRAHRLAFLYVLGWIPNEIDHKNRLRRDNRWINLRSVSHSINQKNMSLRKDNESGINGVSWSKDKQKWRARLMCDGKPIHIGLFDNIEDAETARKIADVKYGFHVFHGNPQQCGP